MEKEKETTELTEIENEEELNYLQLIKKVLSDGNVKQDRTGTGTKSIFGATLRFSLRDGRIPVITTKKVYLKGIITELLWFISGDTSSKTLSDQGVHIWDAHGKREYLDSRGLTENAENDLGPIYGFQWRHFGAEYNGCEQDYTGKGIDQLADVIKQIKTDPNSRRILFSAWNPTAISKMALPPCHVLAQFYVANNELSCILYQRSADLGLGVPFNITSYALLTHLIAKCCGLGTGEFIHFMGDCHVYLNHEEALREQVLRKPFSFPRIRLNPLVVDIDKFTADDIKIENYWCHPTIKMDLSV